MAVHTSPPPHAEVHWSPLRCLCPWVCSWGAGARRAQGTGAKAGWTLPWRVIGPSRWAQVGPLVAKARSMGYLSSSAGFWGGYFHGPCSKGRILLSRADKEEASLQSLSKVALIEVIRLDGAEVKRRRPYGVTFIFVRFPDKPLIW